MESELLAQLEDTALKWGMAESISSAVAKAERGLSPPMGGEEEETATISLWQRAREKLLFFSCFNGVYNLPQLCIERLPNQPCLDSLIKNGLTVDMCLKAFPFDDDKDPSRAEMCLRAALDTKNTVALKFFTSMPSKDVYRQEGSPYVDGLAWDVAVAHLKEAEFNGELLKAIDPWFPELHKRRDRERSRNLVMLACVNWSLENVRTVVDSFGEKFRATLDEDRDDEGMTARDIFDPDRVKEFV